MTESTVAVEPHKVREARLANNQKFNGSTSHCHLLPHEAVIPVVCVTSYIRFNGCRQCRCSLIFWASRDCNLLIETLPGEPPAFKAIKRCMDTS